MNQAEYNRRIVETFGITIDCREVGMILSNGDWIDFSGRHYAVGYVREKDRFVPAPFQDDYRRGQRDVDHSEIPSFDDDERHDKFWLMQEYGFARTASCYHVHIGARPSPKLVKSIEQLALACAWQKTKYRAGRDPYPDEFTVEAQAELAWNEGTRSNHPRREDSLVLPHGQVSVKALNRFFNRFYVACCSDGIEACCPHGGR